MPALGSVNARVNTAPQLSATFSDPDAVDTGSIEFQLCSSWTGCSTPLQTDTTAAGIVNGSNGTWTPASLADGLYYWRAQSIDNSGNVSGWSATSSFTVDTVPPENPTFGSPSDGGRVAHS